MSKTEIEAIIEYQKIIGEANQGGYQPVRFTRVKYNNSDQPHIDIRKFQCTYDDEGEDIYYPTKYGFRFPESEFRIVVKNIPFYQRLMCIRQLLKRALPF